MNPAEPNCAICNAPPQAQCPCEADGLKIAVQDAERRVMEPVLAEVRDWVIRHARNHVLRSFNSLQSHRRAQHSAYVSSLQQAAYYHYAAPNPTLLQAAEMELQCGIDEDWRRSVQTYPEVLDYFYNLVDLVLPGDNSVEVTDPPLDGRTRVRRGRRRESIDRESPSAERRSTRGGHASRHRRTAPPTAPPSVPSVPPPPPPPSAGGPINMYRAYGW
ncbi:MAG: hypothetical protein M1819_003497 [Sarea resinae]|nr:MAG: hypothetical protein M1819_003497 [Sarea resinae]